MGQARGFGKAHPLVEGGAGRVGVCDERKAVGISDLPSTLHNAVKALREDEVVKSALGQHIYTNFVETKKVEWASYAQFVSQWEVDNYLDLY